MSLEPFTFVLERLGQLLINEIKFLSTDKEKLFENLKKQVELAQSFVRDVEEENQQVTISHVLETEIKHIMEILPQIEDFLDTLHLEDTLRREEVQPSQQQISCFPKFIACFSSTSNPLVQRHRVLDKAKQLSDDLQATRRRAEPYHRQSNCPPVTQRPRPQTRPNIIEDQLIVGLEEDVEALVAKLIGKDGDHATTLAIVGMGGAGKTTLARKIYNHKEITGRFTSRAWVCVSQEWNSPQLFREICQQVHIPLTDGEISTAGIKLQEFLQRSSYFIVLDDVWKKEALQELLPILLSACSVGSGRVLITTRNEKIVKFRSLGHVHIHKVRRLTKGESWRLFSIIVRDAWHGIDSFEDEGEFALLGKEMLTKCDGLPLAIVALVGLLSTKATIQKWESIKNSVMSKLMIQDSGCYDYGAVKKMLELSYFDLPYDLKPCFLYPGIFKEDDFIVVENLIQLWIGEGFIRTNQHNECETPEETAWNFLDELLLRNVVHAVSRDVEGKAREIRIHDLVRGLCIEKARDVNFFDLSSRSTSPSDSKEPMPYRAVVDSKESYSISNPRLRSIIQISILDSRIKLDLAYEKVKLLKVLHLKYVNLEGSAEEIGNLILLRYLRIDHCDGVTSRLLESIKRLRNLLTLMFGPFAIGNLENLTVPNNMVGSMEYLRYVRFEGVKMECPMFGVNGSRSLQHLASKAGKWLTKELHVDSMINSLRRLSLQGIDSQEQLEAIYEFVSNSSNHLNELELLILNERGLEFDLQRMNLKCCRFLNTISLRGQIRNQLEPLFFPPNLLYLALGYSKIEKEKDLERALAQLHRLRCLYLYSDAYEGDKLTMSGLPQLQELTLTVLHNLKELIIEEGALSQLQKIEIHHCRQLERISEGISGIRTLQYFYAFGMSKGFYERFQRPSENEDIVEGGGGGKDFHLIRHIPNILDDRDLVRKVI